MNKIILAVIAFSLMSCANQDQVTSFDPKIENQIKDLQNKIDEQQKKDHHYLSPNHFKLSKQSFKKAKQLAARGEPFEVIDKVLEKGRKHIKHMSTSVELAEVHLSDTLKARKQAIDENAQTTELFKEAEKKLFELGEDLEEQDINNVIEEREKVRLLYTKAEIRSIKDRALSAAKEFLQKAENEPGIDYFEAELAATKNDIQSAEMLIERFKDTPSKYKAAIAKAESGAERLHIIAEAGSWLENRPTRDIVLDFEKRLNAILSVVNKSDAERLNFNNKISSIKSEIERIPYLYTALTDAQLDLINKRWKIDKISSTKNNLNKKLKKKEWSDKKLQEIRSLFQKDEAEILVKGNDLIVQMKGLNFGFDSARLPSNSDTILQKLIRTLDTLNYPTIEILGHADSIGDPLYNKRLSQKRAQNLSNYLIDNSALLEQQTESIGKGFMSPLTENKTQEGRKTNRRIDIVLKSVVN